MRIIALLTLPLLLAAFSPAQATDQPAARLTEVPVVLSTGTPLGQASITIPAGTELMSYETAGETVVVRQGPFHGEVPLASTRVPQPPAPVIAPAAVSAAAETASATPPPTPAAPARSPASTIAWPSWLLPLLTMATLVYAICATGWWLRLRRSHAALVAAREDEDD